MPEIVKADSEIIIGSTTVKQDTYVGYYINKDFYRSNKKWSVTGNDRVKLVEVLDEGRMCKVRIYPGAIDTYKVSYGDQEIECTIDWERNYIHGPEEIYPYDFFEYRGQGVYSVDSDLVKIVSQDGKKCKIEVLTGRMGSFTLTCETPEGEIKQLPVKIKSLFGGKDEGSVGVVE